MRYYQPEHEAAYRKITQLGYSQWNDLFDQSNNWTYDDFQNRAFLERMLPDLELPRDRILRVLEYGCGTGPAACYLAARGFQVDAFDLIPEAIAIAEDKARERGVSVAFSVGDVCDLASHPVTTRYDLILDSSCLQSIVTAQDRESLFTAVNARLKPDGYYLISTALRVPGQSDGPGYHYDACTGVFYREVADPDADQAMEINTRWYVPYRRHLTAEALRDELVSAGFNVVSLETLEGADVVCRLNTSRRS